MPEYRAAQETYLQYKQRIIDPISDSFCAAKWLNATIWLNAGLTTSCHHPTAHKIDPEEIKTNPSAIHNTLFKKLQRKKMLEGERPEECDYCWKIEDMGVDAISDRTLKTVIYSDASIKEISTRWDHDVKLQTLEIAFDRTCNFACSYCNASVSTTWAKDIKKNGPYKNLMSNGSDDFKNDGSWADVYEKDENPYIKAFWDWWPELSASLTELRITGGEPLMSNDVWKLFDYFEANGTNNISFAINSNLGAKDSLIDRFIEKSKFIEDLKLYTSAEAYGEHSDYIRDGMDYKLWKLNCAKVIENANMTSFNIMMTVNALSLFSMCEFLDDMVELKTKYFDKMPVYLSVNILRSPSLMSVTTLPDHLKKLCKDKLDVWLANNRDNKYMVDFEISGLARLSDYLKIVELPNSFTSELSIRQRDFKLFYEQYDFRRGKNFRTTFPLELIEWYDSIKTNSIISIKAL